MKDKTNAGIPKQTKPVVDEKTFKLTAPTKPGFNTFLRLNIFDSQKASDLVKMGSIKNCLIGAGREVWHSTDYDPVTKTYRDFSLDRMKEFKLNPLTKTEAKTEEARSLPNDAANALGHMTHNSYSITSVIAGALGLPNEIPKNKNYVFELTWEQVARNFIGLDSFTNIENKPLRYLLRAGIALKNTLYVPFGIGATLIQTFTEFLPQALLSVVNLGFSHAYMAWPKSTDKSALAYAKRAGVIVSIALLAPLFIVGKTWFAAGRAFSSANDSRRAGWQVGKEIGGPIGRVIGGTLSTLSVILSAAEWGAALPYISAYAGAAIAAIPKIGIPILHGLKSAAITVVNWAPINNLVSTLGQAMLPVVKPLATAIGTTASTLAVGVSATLAAIATPVKFFLTHPMRVVNNVAEFFVSLKADKPPAPVKSQGKQEVTEAPNKGHDSHRIQVLLGNESPYNSDDELDTLEVVAAIKATEKSMRQIDNKGPLAALRNYVNKRCEDLSNWVSSNSNTSSNQPSKD